MNLQKVRSHQRSVAVSLSKYSSLITAIIGCIVIVGWLFKIELLTSIFPGIVPMRVNAALAFILSGASLWFWHEYNRENGSYPRWKRSLSHQLAILVACIASLALIQFLFNINLGIDELLIKDFTPQIGYEYPGRIAMSAALKFLMLSAALILLNRRIYSLAQGFAFCSFLISLLGLIGYIYQVQHFYTLFSGESIALAAVIAFCILSLGILFADPEQGWLKVITSPNAGGIAARCLLPFVIGIPLILGGFQILTYRSNFMPMEVGIICRSIVNILLLGGVTWWNARFLNKLDLKQRRTDLALRQSYEELENRVAERTKELTKANHRLQESYQLLSSVIEGISDSLFVKDRSGHYVIVNSAMCRDLGKSREEILGLNDDDLFAPAIAQKLKETDNQIMELGESQEIEEEILKNKTEKTYLSTKSPWRDNDGNVIGLIGVIKDISDRKQTEAALKYREWLLRFFVEHTSIPAAVFDTEMRYIIVSQSWLRDYRLGEQNIIGRSHYEVFPEIPQDWKEVHQRCLAGAVESCEEDEFIRADGKIDWLKWEVRPWYEQTGAIGGIILFTEVITARKEAEFALKQSEQRVINILESMSDAYVALDRNWQITYVNQMTARINQVSAEELIGKDHWQVWSGAVGTICEEKYRQAMTDLIPVHFEYFYETRQRWYEIHAYPSTEGLGVYYRDIDDRKRAEANLQTSEEQLRLTLEFAQIGNWAWHLAENKLHWNSKLFQLLGLDSQTAEANYETWRDRIYPEDLERVEAAIYYALENHTDYDTEHRVIYPDGTVHWIIARGRGIYDRSGQAVRMLGVIFDITDRKQAEISLQESEERFRRAIIDSPLPIILHAEDGAIVQINHAWTEITGYSSEDIPTIADWTEKAYGSRKESVREGIERLHHLNCRVYEGEFTIRTSSGETRIWDFYSAPLGKLLDGRKLVISKAIDITERKQAEADLQQYKDIFQFAEHGLAVSKGALLEIVNPAFARMHGYSVQEMIGKPILSLFPAHTWAETICFIQELNEVGHLTYETYHVRKDRTTFPVLLDITMVRDRQGNPLYRIVTMVDISDRKKAEAALQESEERLRLALQAANQGLWDLNIQTGEAIVSAEYARMLGYKPEELQETNAKWKERLHPEERESVYQVYADYIAGKRNDYQVECRQLTKTGEWKWVLSSGKVVEWDRSGKPVRMLGTHTDINDRKQAEENLKESEKQLRSILENMPVMLDAFDNEGNIIVWNQECERVTGYSSEEIIGNPQAWKMVYPDPIYLQTMMKKWAEFGNNYRNWEWDLVSKNGEIKTIAWSNISQEFSVPGWSGWGVGIDITERKKAELGIIQLNQSLEQRVKERTAELTAANKELEAFSYSVSHDLRAPLRAIDGFSKTLLERYQNQLDDRGQHYLDRIRAGTQRMGELIEDMLMLSRVTRAEMKRVSVNLSQMAEEIRKNLSESQPERFVQWNIAPEITALGDAALLRIVLENLLSNAWKFTSNCPETQIEFGINLVSENIPTYFVKDNGVGFDMNYVNKLFIAFQRLHSVNDFPGTGVGLAIVQRIIHRHGGNVWAEGMINQGATFYFTLSSK
ncbi:PAS domain S-box protein [Aerosakkonemataceae cyanobacterium BLCC-F154]|uniref:histidine kinase n=1 Tax=Floridaenema fluviatile BLCC-F154 TaxID=3153640 RepID=A0ABV4YAW3_9CYAN